MTVVLEPRDRTETGPYKFLDFYEERDQTAYAGRERDIREVVARICANRTFVLYAPSGLGKTSLLLAGVFPELRERRFTPVYIRTLEDPLVDLCAAVAKALQSGPITTLEALTSVLAARSARTTIALVFDQFEEFFIHFRHDPSRRAAFVDAVGALVADETINLRVVFSLREDYLAELDEFRDQVTDLLASDYRLRRLSAFGARQAIAQPLIVADIPYDRRLLMRLVDQLAVVGFDPVLLQILCTEVYRHSARREHDRAHLTEEDLEQVGGLDGVVRRYLNRVVEAIPSGSELLSRTLLDALVTHETTKRAVTFETLAQADFSAGLDELQRVLDIFVRHRLLRTEQRGQQVWYELSHERLVEPVLDWLKLDRDFFNFRAARDLVANSCRGETWRTEVETLLSDGQLVHVIGPYASRLRLTPLELEFVYRSAVYRQVDTRQWAVRLGEEACRAILVEYLRSDSSAVRSGAAAASTVLADPSSALGDACLELAMYDADVVVRRAAGRALGTLATDAHLSSIARALRSRRTRRAALEVVADLRQQGAVLSRFRRLWRLRARSIANRRVKRQHTLEMRDRGQQGAVSGLLAGIVWTAAVALPAIAGFGWVLGFPVSPVELALGGGSLLVPAILLGTFLGWSVGRMGALDAAHRGGGHWFRAIMRLRLPYLPLVVFLPFLLIGLDAGAAVTLLSAFGLVLGGHVLVAATTSVARAAVWPDVPARHVWAWALMAGAGLPLLVGGLVLWALATAEVSTDDWDVWLAVFSGTVSLAATVAVCTLARAPAPAALGHRPADLRLVSRLRLGLLLLAVVAWAGLTYGRDSVPFAARSVHVGNGTPVDIEATLRPFLRDAAYVRLVVPGDTPRWMRVASTPVRRETGAEAVIGDTVLGVGDIVFLPGGGEPLTVRGQVRTETPQLVSLAPIPVASTDIHLQAINEWMVMLVRFERSPTSAVWTATLRGTIGGDPGPNARVLVEAPLSRALGRSAGPGDDQSFSIGRMGDQAAQIVGFLPRSALVLRTWGRAFPTDPALPVPVDSDARWQAELQLRAGFDLSDGEAVFLPLEVAWTDR